MRQEELIKRKREGETRQKGFKVEGRHELVEKERGGSEARE